MQVLAAASVSSRPAASGDQAQTSTHCLAAFVSILQTKPCRQFKANASCVHSWPNTMTPPKASATLTGVDICFFGKLMFTLRRSKTADPSVSDFFVHDSARSLYPYGVNPKPCNLAYTPNESGESVSLF
jgi:hypothetical protein